MSVCVFACACVCLLRVCVAHVFRPASVVMFIRHRVNRPRSPSLPPPHTHPKQPHGRLHPGMPAPLPTLPTPIRCQGNHTSSSRRLRPSLWVSKFCPPSTYYTHTHSHTYTYTHTHTHTTPHTKAADRPGAPGGASTSANTANTNPLPEQPHQQQQPAPSPFTVGLQDLPPVSMLPLPPFPLPVFAFPPAAPAVYGDGMRERQKNRKKERDVW